MSNGAITLQCPTCNGVFLTLRQRAGGMETCPHCAVATPRDKYRIVEADLLHRVKVELPSQRPAELLPTLPAMGASAIPSGSATTAPPSLPPQTAPLVPQAPGETPPVKPPLTPFGTPVPTRFTAQQPVPAAPAPASPPHTPAAPAFPSAPPLVTETLTFSHFSPTQNGTAPHQAAPTLFGKETAAPTAAPEKQPVEMPPAFPVTPHGESATPAPAETASFPPAPPVSAPAPFNFPPPLVAAKEPSAPPAASTPSPETSTEASSAGTSPIPGPAPEKSAPFAPPPATLVMAPASSGTPPPAWPGLGLAAEPAPVAPPAKAVQPAQLPPLKPHAPVAAGTSREAPKPASAATSSSSAGLRFFVLLTVLAVIGWLGWTYLHKPEAIRVAAGPAAPSAAPAPPAAETPAPKPKPAPETPAVTASTKPEQTPAPPATVPATPKPATPQIPATPPTPPAPPVVATPPAPATPPPMPEETRRAVPVTPLSSTPASSGAAASTTPGPSDVNFSTAEAQRVLQGLDDAETPEDRLKLIYEPGKHAVDVERFFNSLEGHLDTGLTEPNPGDSVEMTAQKKVQLFRTFTRRCPSGAMIRLHSGQEGQPLLDWPLFAQSHNYLYDTFANSAESREQKPTWFTVLCKRSHDFELKQPERDFYISVDAQGSLSGAGTAKVYVHKDSMAGRYLDSHMNWQTTYLSRILLGKAVISGKTLTVILDCTGTTVER